MPSPSGHAFLSLISVQRLSPMRLLCECSEVSACEALFYTHLAPECAAIMPTPRCFFVDFNEVSGTKGINLEESQPDHRRQNLPPNRSVASSASCPN